MSYNNITILKFQELQEAELLADGNPFTKKVNQLSVITGRPADEFRRMNINDLNKEEAELSWLADPLPTEWVKEFECQGERFTVVNQTAAWTAEQFISMSNLTKDKDRLIENLHLVMAVLCLKEKGELLSTAELDRRSKMFQDHLPITIAYPTALFFSAVMASLSNNTKYCSIMNHRIKKLKKMQNLRNRTGSGKSGIGTSRLMIWLGVTGRNTTTTLGCRFMISLIICAL